MTNSTLTSALFIDVDCGEISGLGCALHGFLHGFAHILRLRIVDNKGDMVVFFGYDTSRENVDISPSEAWLSLLLALLMLRLDVVDGFKAVSGVIM